MHYVYVLKSLKDGMLYTGYSSDLRTRFKNHQGKQSRNTSHRGPWKLIYYEACISKKDALIRERYLKSAWGKRYLKNRTRYSA